MKGKKGLYIALSVCVLAIFVGGGTAAYKHQQKVKAEQQRVEMEKKALEEAKKKEKKLEEETRKAVDNLFADKEKHFLNDSYTTETLQQVKNVVSRVKNEKLKKEWNETLKKAEECYQQIEQSKQSMAALFKNEEKSELADDVTREMIDALKKQVEENTPQKAAQESLQKDMETAYQLMEQKEEAQKEQERKEQEQKEKEEKEQEAREREQQARNAAPSVSGSENSSANGNSNPASDSNSNNPSGSAQTQPIVASMNLANQTNQIITVVASGTSAQVTFWQKSNTGWGQVFSTYGQVGSQGVGPADEYHSYTPRGAYSLGFAFGTNNPGTSLSFRQITNRSYWISNVDDPNYNTWQERDFSASVDEHLASYSSAYQYAVVINYNTACVKGGGSAFFLHCGGGSPTAGCVAIPTGYMRQALQTLQSGAYIVNVRSEQELLNY